MAHLLAITVPGTGFEIPFNIFIIGLITGLTYALLAVGLTLTYKASRVINFAHADVGALAATILVVLVSHGWPYWLAFVLALGVSFAVGWLVYRLVIQRLRNASRLIALVATIGVSQVLLVITLVIPKTEALRRSLFPTPVDWSFKVASLRLTPGFIMILVLAPVAVGGVALLLNRTTLGLGSRAASENDECASLLGVPVHRVSALVWGVVGLLSGVGAILAAGTQPLAAQQGIGPSLLLRALAAALLGGLVSLRVIFGAGVLIGLAEALVAWNYPTGGKFELILFAVVLGSLFFRKGLGATQRGAEGTSWSLGGNAVAELTAAQRQHPRYKVLVAATVAALAAVAIALPMPLSNAQRVLASSVLIYAVIGLSLVLLVGMAGQVTLGHMTFVGLGAAVAARLLLRGYPVWVVIVYCMLAAGLASLLIGIPALRVRGLFLAVSSLGFAVAGSAFLFRVSWLKPTTSTYRMDRFEIFGVSLTSERNYYYFCLAVLVAVAMLVRQVRKTGIGRTLAAVRDNEPTAASLSLSPTTVKLTAFVLSGMLAGLGGFLYGGLLVNFTSAGFGPPASLSLVAMVIFGGITSVTGAILGAVWVRGIPYLLGTNWGLFSSGFGLLLVLLVLPGGLASIVFRMRDKIVSLVTGLPVERVLPTNRDEVPRPNLPARVRDDVARSTTPAIEARGVIVQYGGIRAVNQASLCAMPGEIVGLVGPNGAGKTTLFDVMSGQQTPTAGTVLLHGEDVSDLGPHQRARHGLGRSFQQARLFDDLTLAEALTISLEKDAPSELVPSLLSLPPSRRAERAKRLRADELLELMGLTPFARRKVSELSTGTRRLAELAEIVGLGATVVLLDEPMAGVAQREVEAFVPVLREIRDHLDATIVIIDHDIPMLTGLVDRMYVLANGSVLAEGPPSVMVEDPAVIAAYLGTDERAIARSGTGKRKLAKAAK